MFLFNEFLFGRCDLISGRTIWFDCRLHQHLRCIYDPINGEHLSSERQELVALG